LGMELDMFRTVPLPSIRCLFMAHSAVVYVIQVCRQLSSRTRMVLLESCPYGWHYKGVHLTLGRSVCIVFSRSIAGWMETVAIWTTVSLVRYSYIIDFSDPVFFCKYFMTYFSNAYNFYSKHFLGT
jgi:hypothetical protein